MAREPWWRALWTALGGRAELGPLLGEPGEIDREREQGAIPEDDALFVAVADEGFEPP